MNRCQFIEKLVMPQTRLGPIMEWLHQEVWSTERYKKLGFELFLTEGERLVHDAEELVLAAAPAFYDELAQEAEKPRNLISYTLTKPKRALIILDGASIRELPMLELMARQTGYAIEKIGFSFSALPSETTPFVGQRLLGKAIAPSELPRRRELLEKNISTYYYDAVFRTFPMNHDTNHYLLWSQFPDSSYKDLGARFASHFEQMVPLYEQVWKNMIMQIPNDFEIIITSDHGYIFFGQGMESKNDEAPARLLNQGRNKYFSEAERWPGEQTGLKLFPQQRLAMLCGRIKNRPQGPAAAHAYRHGGLSLMEVLTPWLIIKKSR